MNLVEIIRVSFSLWSMVETWQGMRSLLKPLVIGHNYLVTTTCWLCECCTGNEFSGSWYL